MQQDLGRKSIPSVHLRGTAGQIYHLNLAILQIGTLQWWIVSVTELIGHQTTCSYLSQLEQQSQKIMIEN